MMLQGKIRKSGVFTGRLFEIGAIVHFGAIYRAMCSHLRSKNWVTLELFGRNFLGENGAICMCMMAFMS